MKVVAIIQARMGSTRLPGKVLLDLAGEPMLARNVIRVCNAKLIDEVVVATTTKFADDDIVALCAQRSWPCFRGSEEDVLDRYYQAAIRVNANVIVRITSDCPLIDPGLIDQVVRAYQASPHVDYASNILQPRTFPRGLDTEAFGFDVLERLWHEDTNPATREHVTMFIHKNLPAFHTRGITHVKDFSRLRWTVDTEEDLVLIRKIYEHFGNDAFSWKNVLSLLDQNPDWHAVNAHIQQKEI